MAAQAATGRSSVSRPSDSSVKADSVHVAVRVRPLSSSEASQGSASCVDVADNSVLLAEKQFDFDAAFPPSTQQERVYAELVEPMIDQFFDGYNATVFAYGQTGSGKTYTMGNEFKISVAPTQRGIIPRVMDDVFRKVKSSKMTGNTVLKLSYLEILNEEIRDLLVTSDPGVAMPATTLSVQGDSERGIVISGLSEHVVKSVDQVGDLLRSGALIRATASTNMNSQSSRSHAICTLIMKQCHAKVAGGGTETWYSKFHLVDLAGSERVKRTNCQGERFKEGVNINRGLLALGNVINALCERKRSISAATHVPYRDSKLTRLLQDSLGGNSKTLMIACVSPADLNYEETSNTLRYASRARHIENEAVINKINVAADAIKEENQRLKEELILANRAKKKWEQIAGDLLNMSDKASYEHINSRLTPAEVTQTLTSISQRGQTSKSGQLSRLEQLRAFQSQKLKSQQSKDDAVKRKVDDVDTLNKHRRALSPTTRTLGTNSLIGKKKNSLLPPHGSSGQVNNLSDGSMEDMTKLCQQIMTSQEDIYAAKKTIQANLVDRKNIAQQISRLEGATSSENTMELTKLRGDLNSKTTNIRLLQQKLAPVEKNVSLPAGFFPTNVEACHQLIRHLIETAIIVKEESMRCNSELIGAKEEIADQRNIHNREVNALETKIAETLKEMDLLREHVGTKKIPRKRKARESYETIEMLFSSSDDEADDSGADSDYVEEVNRPRHGRKKQRGGQTIALKVSTSKSGDVMDEIDELLDTSVATCCSCLGKCATKACACKSQDRICSDCSCDPSKCSNTKKDVTPEEMEVVPKDISPNQPVTNSSHIIS